MFTPEDKTKEKESQFSTTGLLTGQWRDTDEAQKRMNSDDVELSLDELLTPQYEDNNYQKYINPDDENSVYNPDSDLGGSVFGKSPFDYYLDEKEKEREERRQQERKNEEDEKRKFYMVLGLAATGYLGYRMLK